MLNLLIKPPYLPVCSLSLDPQRTNCLALSCCLTLQYSDLLPTSPLTLPHRWKPTVKVTNICVDVTTEHRDILSLVSVVLDKFCFCRYLSTFSEETSWPLYKTVKYWWKPFCIFTLSVITITPSCNFNINSFPPLQLVCRPSPYSYPWRFKKFLFFFYLIQNHLHFLFPF